MRQGILTVVDIEPDLDAWKAGVKINDMIVSIQDKTVSKNNLTIDNIFDIVQELKKEYKTIAVCIKRATKNASI